MVHLDYRDARPIYTQIVDGFREQIVTGILCTGEKLPSVRELATQLAINPNTIQRAYRQLELEGWIVTAAGKGCFVSSAPDRMEQERERLLKQLDQLAAELEAAGISREDMARRIRKEET